MENFTSLKFLQDAGTIDVRDRAPECHDGDKEEDDDDSYFELVLTAPEENDNAEKKVERKNDTTAKAEEELAEKGGGGGTNRKAQSPIALLKSAPKFRVLFLGFRKNKPEKIQAPEEAIPAAQKHQLHKSPESVQSKRFAVECDVEEVRIASLFSRDNSLRSKLHSERATSDSPNASTKSPKDFPKYLKLIKPFYVRASKRYSESSRLSSDRSSTDSPWSSPATVSSSSPMKLPEKRGDRSSGFRALSKHLGKCRSASSNLRMTPSPAANRRDDSLMLQNDGIQSAILHCKRSLYNTSSQEISTLWCSTSDPATGKTETPASNASVASMRCTSI